MFFNPKSDALVFTIISFMFLTAELLAVPEAKINKRNLNAVNCSINVYS